MINMKRVLFAIIMIIFSVEYTSAQSTNNNYLYATHVWAVVSDNLEENGADADITYCYTWSTDSIINDITYRTVYLGHYHPGELLDMLYDGIYDSVLCYREDGKQIFRFDNALGKDVLLYDFGLKVGDETTILDGRRVKVTEELSADELENYCYSIYTKNNEPPKAWRVCSVDDDTYEDIWIDGAGSLYTGLLLRSDFPKDVSLTTVFNPTSSWARYTPNDKIQPVLLQEYWRDPDYENWDRQFRVNVEFVADTLKISGISRFFPYTHLFRCHLHDDEIIISAIPINPMCSLVDEYLTSKYEIKFPGFEAGTYTVKKEDERLWMDNLKDTTLVCQGPATGIQEINTSTNNRNDNAIYDLSGRRLYTIPERGIYIQDGKKVAK